MLNVNERKKERKTERKKERKIEQGVIREEKKRNKCCRESNT